MMKLGRHTRNNVLGSLLRKQRKSYCEFQRGGGSFHIEGAADGAVLIVKYRYFIDCAYGDRDENFCSQLNTRDCYDAKVRRTCCDTCRRFRYHFSGQSINIAHLICRNLSYSVQTSELLDMTAEIFVREIFVSPKISDSVFPGA